MSYTAIKAVWPGEKTETLIELKNSQGSAPLIWGAFSERYLKSKYSYLLDDENEIWSLYKRTDILPSLRAVLLMTFDRAYILKKNYEKAAADIEFFLKFFDIPKSTVNHWPRIAEIFKENLDIPAIGFQMTSVSEDLFEGTWNAEKEELEPPDWKEFWSVYDELDNYK